ncbi:HAD-IA family hydrolase [Bacteroides sp. 224]|uniref:HAD-IA family hydrolase n=1 Tax=Bacteroides sp. 224 TaxID=2302936 RepID=UPI0013D17D8A|nr:HAD-IA family hydrolase [Bacteroides sp. 224]NDV65846.1 HAD family hydrolase [Bacteroides sp. 224]
MNYSTILFDFDYTLADSSRGIVTCFQNVLCRHNYLNISDEAIKRTIGKTLEDSFALLTGVTDKEQLEAWRKEYVKEADSYMTVNTLLYPDTLPVLKELKQRGIKIGILSTKYRYRIKEFFDNYLPAESFDIIIGGEDVEHHKPSPEGLYKAMKSLLVSPNDVLYVGDSIVDAETAVAGGVDFVGVTSGMTTREELKCFPNRKIISNLGELLF